jgi:predicted GNAT family acetyltransferase
MTITLRRFETAEAFAEAAMLFLLQREAEHCMMIGTVTQTIADPERWDGSPSFATVDREGMPVAAAMRTPPYPPSLSLVLDLDAIPLLVEHFAEPPGLTGISAQADAGHRFAEEWARRTGDAVTIAMRQGLYKVERVQTVEGVPGRLRRATSADRDRLVEWMRAFTSEAFGDGDEALARRAERNVDLRLADGEHQSGFAFWEDEESVALGGYTGPTPNGIRIGPIYTLPRFRRRGYGSALTAALSRLLIDEGRQFCALFTDLENPTSNHIYQAVGYEPVLDWVTYRFTR